MLQIIFNGFITGIVITLPALAITLLFGVLRFPNFAVGSMLTLAAYIVFTFNVLFGIPLVISSIITAIIFGFLLILIDQLTFAKLRGSSSITLMVCSLGLSFHRFCRISESWSSNWYHYHYVLHSKKSHQTFFFMDIRMNREQIIIIIVSTIAMIFMYILLKHMPIGRAMRAVSDNQSLSLVRGIDTPMIIKWTWFISGILLTTGGVLIGMDRAIEPPMGSSYLIAIFAAAILGGLGSPLGAFFGSIIIGVVGELSTLVIPPNYRTGIPLAVIALILIFRPQGIFGKPNIKK